MPGATFSPAGVCTFPKDETIPEYLPGVSDNKSVAKLPQLPGWAWGDCESLSVLQPALANTAWLWLEI